MRSRRPGFRLTLDEAISRFTAGLVEEYVRSIHTSQVKRRPKGCPAFPFVEELGSRWRSRLFTGRSSTIAPPKLMLSKLPMLMARGPTRPREKGNAASFAWQLDTEMVDAASRHGSGGSFFFVLSELGE